MATILSIYHYRRNLHQNPFAPITNFYRSTKRTAVHFFNKRRDAKQQPASFPPRVNRGTSISRVIFHRELIERLQFIHLDGITASRTRLRISLPESRNQRAQTGVVTRVSTSLRVCTSRSPPRGTETSPRKKLPAIQFPLLCSQKQLQPPPPKFRL